MSAKDMMIEILLVEDNPDDVELAVRALRKNNLANAIQVARDGEQALEFIFGTDTASHALLNNRPRLILLDLKLPKVDGLTVLERLKADPRSRTIPVVIVTTSSEEPDLQRAYELGVNSYLVKPVDFEQFVETVRHLGFYWLLLNRSPATQRPDGGDRGS